MILETHQHCSPKHAFARHLQPLRQFKTRASFAIQNIVKVGRRSLSFSRHLGNSLAGGQKCVLESHVHHTNSIPLSGQGGYSTCPVLPGGKNKPMAWPQLTNFKQRLSEYQALTGKNQEQVAEDLGTSYGTLRFWLSGTRPPSLASLQTASRVFKCSVAEFIDDPGRLYGDQDLTEKSPEERFFASMVIKGVLTKDLTDEQRQFIIEDIFRTVSRVRALPFGGSGRGGKDHSGEKSDLHTDLPGSDPRSASRKKG